MVIIVIQSTIENLAAQTANLFLQNGYNHRSIHEKEVVMRKIILLHKQHGCDCYSPEIMALFLRDAERRYQRQEIGKIRFRFYQKTADYLTQFHENGNLDLYSRNISTNLTPYYEKIFTRLHDYEGWGKSTKHYIRQFSMPYFKWLLQNGVTSLEQVTDEMIRKYLLDCSNRMTLNSVDTTKRVLKKLHRYLYEVEICKDSFSDTLSFTVPTEHRIKKPVPQEDIAAVLSIINRNTAIGKRDYLKKYLALFHPEQNLFSEQYVFYVTRNQNRKRMTEDNVRKLIAKYGVQARKICKEVPENVHPHLFRHSWAMVLYQNGVDLTLISQWLGHSNLETTLIYAHADTELKRKALEKAVPVDSPLKEHLNAERYKVSDEELLKRLCGLK